MELGFNKFWLNTSYPFVRTGINRTGQCSSQENHSFREGKGVQEVGGDERQ